MACDKQPDGGTEYSGWESVRLAVDLVLSAQLERFEPSTAANVRDVLSVCERLTKTPDGVKRGCWPTLVLWWGKFELEVFGDRVEVYRLHDKDTDIWYEEHTPGESFTPRFLAEWKTLAP
jgi:hypothetical protein